MAARRIATPATPPTTPPAIAPVLFVEGEVASVGLMGDGDGDEETDAVVDAD
jgi:hypothetical protein